MYEFSGLTEEVSRIFSNVEHTIRPYEFQDNVHLQITFEFDLNLYRIDRDVYSVLDWVGDVGGLFEGLYIPFKVISGFFYFRALEHFLIERLYVKTKRNDFSSFVGNATTLNEPLSDRKTRLCR